MELLVSRIERSPQDRVRNVTLPQRLSTKLAEFVGIMIGDGYLYQNFNKYRIGIVGNPKTDYDYFVHIGGLIKHLFNIDTKIVKRGRGLRIIFGSKAVFYFLTKVIGLDHGQGKGQRVTIPHHFLEHKEYQAPLLRGIFDTDGSIFVSDKKGAPDYPCIELTTTSTVLAHQVKEILVDMNFRVAKIRRREGKAHMLPSEKVSLYGRKNAELWFENVGFSNPLKQERLKRIVKIKKDSCESLNGDAGI